MATVVADPVSPSVISDTRGITSNHVSINQHGLNSTPISSVSDSRSNNYSISRLCHKKFVFRVLLVTIYAVVPLLIEIASTMSSMALVFRPDSWVRVTPYVEFDDSLAENQKAVYYGDLNNPIYFPSNVLFDESLYRTDTFLDETTHLPFDAIVLQTKSLYPSCSLVDHYASLGNLPYERSLIRGEALLKETDSQSLSNTLLFAVGVASIIRWWCVLNLIWVFLMDVPGMFGSSQYSPWQQTFHHAFQACCWIIVTCSLNAFVFSTSVSSCLEAGNLFPSHWLLSVHAACWLCLAFACCLISIHYGVEWIRYFFSTHPLAMPPRIDKAPRGFFAGAASICIAILLFLMIMTLMYSSMLIHIPSIAVVCQLIGCIMLPFILRHLKLSRNAAGSTLDGYTFAVPPLPWLQFLVAANSVTPTQQQQHHVQETSKIDSDLDSLVDPKEPVKFVDANRSQLTGSSLVRLVRARHPPHTCNSQLDLRTDRFLVALIECSRSRDPRLPNSSLSSSQSIVSAPVQISSTFAARLSRVSSTLYIPASLAETETLRALMQPPSVLHVASPFDKFLQRMRRGSNSDSSTAAAANDRPCELGANPAKKTLSLTSFYSSASDTESPDSSQRAADFCCDVQARMNSKFDGVRSMSSVSSLAPSTNGDDDGKVCQICFEPFAIPDSVNPNCSPRVVFYPCGHSGICQICATLMVRTAVRMQVDMGTATETPRSASPFSFMSFPPQAPYSGGNDRRSENRQIGRANRRVRQNLPNSAFICCPLCRVGVRAVLEAVGENASNEEETALEVRVFLHVPPQFIPSDQNLV